MPAERGRTRHIHQHATEWVGRSVEMKDTKIVCMMIFAYVDMRPKRGSGDGGPKEAEDALPGHAVAGVGFRGHAGGDLDAVLLDAAGEGLVRDGEG